jgi:hypothetical protein
MKYGYKWVTGFGLAILFLCLSLVYIAISPAQAQGSGRSPVWRVFWCDNYWGCGHSFDVSYINFNQGVGDGYHNYAVTRMRWPGTDNGISRTIWFRTGYDDDHQLRINGTIVTNGVCCSYAYGYYTAKPGEIVTLEFWSNNRGGGPYIAQVAWDPNGTGSYSLLGDNNVGLQSETEGGGSFWYSSSESSTDLAQKNSDRSRLAALSSGNKININQSGYGVNVDIIQEGPINVIQGRSGIGDAQLSGDYNTLRIRQGDGAGRNLIELDVNGQSNTVTLLQGWNGTWPNVGKDGVESGGHFIDLKVIGSVNTVHFNQTNAGGANSGHYNKTEVIGNTNTLNVNQTWGAGVYHTFYANVTGNSNYINVLQGAAGAQFMDLVVAGSGHTVNATQTGSGSHRATINLTNAGGASTLNLTQQGTINQVYNISQACANLSGCSVTVTQGSP